MVRRPLCETEAVDADPYLEAAALSSPQFVLLSYRSDWHDGLR
jgi:hypothetical protein